jgi:hypothetical protein
MVSRVFYEASRDLDSRPSPRANRVEACRPRGCFVSLECSGGPATAVRNRVGRRRPARARPSPTPPAAPPRPEPAPRPAARPRPEPDPARAATEKDAVPGRLRNPFRPASAVFLGGAASHLFGLALRGSVPRRFEPSHCWSRKQLAGRAAARTFREKPARRARARDPAAAPARACLVPSRPGAPRVRPRLSTLPQ